MKSWIGTPFSELRCEWIARYLFFVVVNEEEEGSRSCEEAWSKCVECGKRFRNIFSLVWEGEMYRWSSLPARIITWLRLHPIPSLESGSIFRVSRRIQAHQKNRVGFSPHFTPRMPFPFSGGREAEMERGCCGSNSPRLVLKGSDWASLTSRPNDITYAQWYCLLSISLQPP